MRVSAALAVAGAAVSVSADALRGFNYGNTFGDNGAAKQESDFEAEFKRAQNLQGAQGFNAARLYTMIQASTKNDPISAIQAAINTNTKLLLGMWASAGQDAFNNELIALQSAIKQHGTKFTDLVVGLSVGSEDLYRITPTGIENKAGVGAGPDVLASYIAQVKNSTKGTSASGFSIGHVDTWTAWVNGSNSAVIEAVDWLGFDGYPYFQSTEANSIDNALNLFTESFGATQKAGNGKPVWLTETGWPVSGKVSGQAVASTQNAERYWQEVACPSLGKYNTFWYTLQDAVPSTPDPSFGIIGSDLNSQPLYDLTCKASNTTSSSSVSSSASATSSGSSSASASATGSSSPSISTGSAGSAGSSSGSPASNAGTPAAAPSSSSASAPAPASTTTASHTSAGSVLNSKHSTVAAVFALICLVGFA